MKRIITTFAVLAAICLATTAANAGGYGHYGYRNYGGYGNYGGFGGYGSVRVPVYHAPSVHFDRQYHVDYSHWTPGRGFHTHGHYHTVPHFTPGHFDTLHGNHIHGNPWYHH